jgi:hypothetical protein
MKKICGGGRSGEYSENSLRDIPLEPYCSFSRWSLKYRKKREAKIKKILEDYLNSLGFVIHEEFLMPHREWLTRVDIYATKGGSKYIFEVKPSFEPRGIGQAAWYSFYYKKSLPEINTLLAFPCHEFLKTSNPEIKEFVKKHARL